MTPPASPGTGGKGPGGRSTGSAPANGSGSLPAVLQWEESAARRLAAAREADDRRAAARATAERIVAQARARAAETADRRHAELLAAAADDAEEVRRIGREQAARLEHYLTAALPDLVAAGIDLVVPPPASTPSPAER